MISEFSGKVLAQGAPRFVVSQRRHPLDLRGAWRHRLGCHQSTYIMTTDNGATLCIPTVFVSWTGEALDKKTPLLRVPTRP